MGAAVTHRRFTVDDYYRMAEAGILRPGDRVELIEGEIVEMTPIGREHAARVDCLNNLYCVKLAGRAIVRVQNPVRLNRNTEPQPDVAILRSKTDYYASGHPGPEDVLLIIEVADSSLAYDRGVKMSEYARAGIREAWLVDLAAGVVEVSRKPGPSGYGDVRAIRRGQSLAPEAFPDVSIRVDDILG